MGLVILLVGGDFLEDVVPTCPSNNLGLTHTLYIFFLSLLLLLLLFLGLEVHDPTPTKLALSAAQMASFGVNPFAPGSLPSAWSSHRNAFAAAMANYTVFRGHVTTVEPGVYFIPELLELVRKDGDGSGRSKHINWKKLDEGNYVEVGGVRIEDVILIDHDGKKRIITYLEK
jgi:Xaa-Pro aminopeptidase